MARRIHRTSALTATCLTLLAVHSLSTTVEAAGPWRTDYQRARAEARREGKALLLHFSAVWCGPCRIMERDVLSSSQLAPTLGDKIIAVKIDSDHYPQLTQQLGIQALPSDVFLSPEGKVIKRYSGSQSLNSYLRMISSVASTVVLPQRVVASKPAETEKPNVVVQPKIEREITPKADNPIGDQFAKVDEEIPETIEPMIGLRGFCPVTLWKSREWKAGRKEYSMEYRGVVYHMSSAQTLQEFRDEPKRFAPRLLGCDPVKLVNSNLAVPGDTSYGAFYDGELYLFESDASRRVFKTDPQRFTKVRQVRLPDVQRRL